MHTLQELIEAKKALSLSDENFLEHIKKVLNVKIVNNTYYWSTFSDPFRESPRTLEELQSTVEDYKLFYHEITDGVLPLMEPEELELYLSEHGSPNTGVYNATDY